MNRRSVLRGIGVGGVAALAGCLGGSSDADGSGRRAPDAPEPTGGTLSIVDFLDREEDGSLVMDVTVENETGEERSATLAVTIAIDGDTFEETTAVELSPGERSEYTLEFDLSYERFLDGANVEFEFR